MLLIYLKKVSGINSGDANYWKFIVIMNEIRTICAGAAVKLLVDGLAPSGIMACLTSSCNFFQLLLDYFSDDKT
jgi:hypothetical protein